MQLNNNTYFKKNITYQMQYIIGGIVNSGFGKELKGDLFIAKY